MSRKTVVIAVREYQAAIRTKAFIISLILMPVFMGGSIGIQVFLRDKVDVTTKRIVIVDGTGRLADALIQDADKRNHTEIFENAQPGGKQVKPRFELSSEPPAGDDPAGLQMQTLALSDRVRQGEVFAFVVIHPEVLEVPVNEQPFWAPTNVAYHSNNPTYDDARNWLRGVLTRHVHELRLQASNIDTSVVMKALDPVRMEALGLLTRDISGQVQAAQKTNQLLSIFVPFGMLMLMYMVVMISAQPLIQSVLEEKMQRIAEVLVGCASPFEIMMGKLLGTIAVSLTMVSVYLLGGMLALNWSGYGSFFPTHLVGWFIVFQCLAVLMYGSMFAAVGAAVNDLKEAQSMLTPLMLVIWLPFFLWFNIIKEPNTPLATLASLFPPATPMLMVVRMAVPPGIPTWQPILGIVLVLIMTLLTVFAAGRVFRIGLLMQGKAPKFRELLSWAISG